MHAEHRAAAPPSAAFAASHASELRQLSAEHAAETGCAERAVCQGSSRLVTEPDKQERCDQRLVAHHAQQLAGHERWAAPQFAHAPSGHAQAPGVAWGEVEHERRAARQFALARSGRAQAAVVAQGEASQPLTQQQPLSQQELNQKQQRPHQKRRLQPQQQLAQRRPQCTSPSSFRVGAAQHANDAALPFHELQAQHCELRMPMPAGLRRAAAADAGRAQAYGAPRRRLLCRPLAASHLGGLR